MEADVARKDLGGILFHPRLTGFEPLVGVLPPLGYRFCNSRQRSPLEGLRIGLDGFSVQATECFVVAVFATGFTTRGFHRVYSLKQRAGSSLVLLKNCHEHGAKY